MPQILLFKILLELWPSSLPAEQPKEKIAVLPLTIMGTSQPVGNRIRNQLLQELNQMFNLQITPSSLADSAVVKVCENPSNWWDCLEQEKNLLSVGELLKVDAVLSGQLAAMGDTYVLKLRMAKVGSGGVSSEVVNISEGNQEALLGKFTTIHQWLSPQEPPRAWYERWEYWTIIGAGVVVVTVGSILLFAMPSPEGGDVQWDYRRSLP